MGALSQHFKSFLSKLWFLAPTFPTKTVKDSKPKHLQFAQWNPGSGGSQRITHGSLSSTAMLHAQQMAAVPLTLPGAVCVTWCVLTWPGLGDPPQMTQLPGGPALNAV